MERRLAAIFVADMVGYSRLMEADEAGTIARQKAHRADLIDLKIAEHHGRIVKTTGDGLLVEFASVVDAVESAIAIQRAMAEREADTPEDRRIQYRVGINLGDIVIDGDDILGDGVNVAARLQEIAEPAGIAISATVHEQIVGKIEVAFSDAGDHEVKNIARPIHVWRWVTDSSSAATGPSKTDEPLPLPDKPSIAVLPFENMSGDPEQEYFADGVAEDVLTTLSKIHGLLVIARNSSFMFKGQSVDVREIGRQLGVRYVLEGSVRKAGNRVRLTAQLIDCTDSSHVWADKFDGEIDDVFDLQDRITQEIVTALEMKLTGGEMTRKWREGSGDPRVYEHLNKAIHLYQSFSRHSHMQARQELETALKINPSFPPALVYLGYTLTDQARFGWETSENASFEAALECADRALAADPGWGEAYTVIGYVRTFQNRHDEAVAAGEQAIALAPNSLSAFHMAGMFHGYAGSFREAAQYSTHAQRLSPIAINHSMVDHARAEFHLGHFAAARDIARRVLDSFPNWLTAQTVLVAALWCLHEEDDARAIAGEIQDNRGSFSVRRWSKLYPYRRQKDLDFLMSPLIKAGLPE